jgi:hypothetical protein
MTNMGKNGENTGDRHNKWTETAEAAGLLFGAHAGWRSLLAAPGDTGGRLDAVWRFGGLGWACGSVGGGWAPTPRPWIHTFQPDMATRAYLPKYLWPTQIKKSRCAGSS